MLFLIILSCYSFFIITSKLEVFDFRYGKKIGEEEIKVQIKIFLLQLFMMNHRPSVFISFYFWLQERDDFALELAMGDE